MVTSPLLFKKPLGIKSPVTGKQIPYGTVPRVPVQRSLSVVPVPKQKQIAGLSTTGSSTSLHNAGVHPAQKAKLNTVIKPINNGTPGR